MGFRKFLHGGKNILYGFLIVVISISFVGAQEKSFWKMDGIIESHALFDEDGLSDKTIFELKTKEGLTRWFGRDVHKEVCITGVCKKVHLWLFWNCRGHYLGFELHEYEPLTKGEKEEVFKEFDYVKLNQILSDSNSILSDYNIDKLVEEVDVEADYDEVDGITGATLPAITSAIVEGAVYTSYTLWHTVYGFTRDKIEELLNNRTNSEYLRLLFEQGDNVYSLLAIDLLKKNDQFIKYFLPDLINLLESKDAIFSIPITRLLNSLPINYFDEEFQIMLAKRISGFSQNDMYNVYRLLERIPKMNDKAVVLLLEACQLDQNRIRLKMTFDLLKSSHLENDEILNLLRVSLTDPNDYIQKLTKKLFIKNMLKY